MDASESECESLLVSEKEKIKEIFDWSDTVGLQYMYASGQHLRKATFKDVENAESWDVSTVRALMGNQPPTSKNQ